MSDCGAFLAPAWRPGAALGGGGFFVVNAVRENPDEEADRTGTAGETGEDTAEPEESAEEDPQEGEAAQAEDEEDTAGRGDAGCFVATAVYQDAMHPDVRSLRRFRDRYLAPHAAGRLAIRLYRRFGPGLAKYLLRHPRLARGTRRLLEVLVRGLRRSLRLAD